MLKKRTMGNKYDPAYLFLFDTYNHDNWFEKEDLADTTRKNDKEEWTDVPPMPPLEGNEEKVKEGKALKMLTPKKLLTRLPISKQFI